MATITQTTRPNGLGVHRIELGGTRATTILIAFDAGARTELEPENGMAHFLEHLVFKGGEKYDHYRKVNETAERMGASINAYTSHDLVAFHITCRAEVTPDATDLLTDIVGRPLLDQDELDRERGVVIQEIQRALDQPSTVAEHLIDRAAFGDHPLGRMVLGPEDHLRTFSRDAIVAFRARRWSGARGGVFIAGNVDHAGEEIDELFDRLPQLPEPEPYEAVPAPELQTLVQERDSNQSHVRILYRPKLETDRRTRAALVVYSTLLGGSMGSRLFDEIREQRGLAYSVYALPHVFADAPIVQLGAGLDSEKCVEAYGRMREIVAELHRDGPTEEEVSRARAFAAGRQVLGQENSGAVARLCASMAIVHGEEPDPDGVIDMLDAVTFDEVREVASAVDPDSAAVAVVGPHEQADFA
jgi:predicted Zn-dependent peptidase